MKKYKTLNEALLEANEFDDEIPSIVNPFPEGSDEARGYATALAELAAGLFGDSQEDNSDGQKPDSRLKPLPIPQKPSKSDGDKDSNNQKQKSQTSEPLTPQEVDDLIDRITKARDKTQDVIDDYGDLVNKEAANSLDDINDELDKLADKAENADTEGEAKDITDKVNKLKARLNAIATF